MMKMCPATVMMALLLLLLPLPLLGSGARASRSFTTEGGKFYTIAHRGANADYPESSAPAFRRAIDEGIDFIETDIGATSDGSLICLHDITLSEITDVADRAEFAGKLKTYSIPCTRKNEPATNVTGFFAVDFTLSEIKSLKVKQRFSTRDQSHNGLYDILTFEEYIEIAQAADRVVGIDPEIKNPAFINQHVKWPGNKTFEDVYIETLLKYGYDAPFLSSEWLEKPVFLQTFAPTSILRIANKTSSPKVFNIGAPDELAQDTLQPYSELSTDEYLDFMSSYVVAISTDKNIIAPVDSYGRLLPAAPGLVDKAHARGLQIHPATFRNEAQYMAKNFTGDPQEELAYFIRKLGVDAVMSDVPRTLVKFLDQECT